MSRYDEIKANNFRNHLHRDYEHPQTTLIRELVKTMKFSQQIKERQDYTGFLAKGFYKDLMQELERLEEIEHAHSEQDKQLETAERHLKDFRQFEFEERTLKEKYEAELKQLNEEYATMMELHHE
jgi:hypothetical protein